MNERVTLIGTFNGKPIEGHEKYGRNAYDPRCDGCENLHEPQKLRVLGRSNLVEIKLREADCSTTLAASRPNELALAENIATLDELLTEKEPAFWA